MAAAAFEASRSGRRRWAALLLASALFHVVVLGGFAFRAPGVAVLAEPQAMDVTLIEAPPFIRPLVIKTATPPPPQTRVVVLDAPPRYAEAPARAETEDAGDATDLFGPVFADGLWPRPVLVKSEPCDPKDDLEAAQACRRELLLIGLASEAAPGAKAQP
jgi:hypothetical protein